MVDKKYLLNSEQMASFVSRGFLRFDELIPQEVNERAMSISLMRRNWLPGTSSVPPISMGTSCGKYIS